MIARFWGDFQRKVRILKVVGILRDRAFTDGGWREKEKKKMGEVRVSKIKI